jgi:hypothetical protein
MAFGLIGDILGAVGSHEAGNTLYKAGTTAQTNVQNATAAGQAGVTGALNTATGQVNTGVTNANSTLGGVLGTETANLNPYLEAGKQGAEGLSAYAASNPQFNFQPTQEQLENTPGYKFQLGQGEQAIQNSTAAQGLQSSGNTLKALTQYGQGLAGSYYQNAFTNALQGFQTNQNTTLANLSALTGTGLSGTQQFNNAQTNFGNQASTNQLQSQELLGQLGTQAGEFNANLGETGATTGGKFLMEGAQGKAAGLTGMWNDIGAGANALWGAPKGAGLGSLWGG